MKARLEILTKISDKALIAIVAFLLIAIYFIAIQPTVSLHGKIAKLEAFGGSDAASNPAGGNDEELAKLSSLLAPLTPSADFSSIVLNAVGKADVKLQSFKEEKVGEKEYGGEKGLKKFVLLVSGTYTDLVKLISNLNNLAISSSKIYVNEDGQEIMSVTLLLDRKADL